MTVKEVRDSSGRVTQRHQLKNGKKHGLSVTWYSNGSREEVSYANDVREGRYQLFFRSGARSKDGYYTAGKKSGSWTTFREDGTRIFVTEWWEGEKHGLERQYNEASGKEVLVAETQYQRDRAHGVARNYWSNGQISSTGEYKFGKREGVWKHYYSNGRPMYLKTFSCGMENGPQVSFGSDGKRQSEDVWAKSSKLAQCILDNHVSPCVAAKLKVVAEAFAKTGDQLEVTSGIRSAEKQAELMFEDLKDGKLQEYGAERAALADEIKRAYQAIPGEQRVQNGLSVVRETIRRQMCAGDSVSLHLTEGAVDLRTRNISYQNVMLLKGLLEQQGAHVLPEMYSNKVNKTMRAGMEPSEQREKDEHLHVYFNQCVVSAKAVPCAKPAPSPAPAGPSVPQLDAL